MLRSFAIHPARIFLPVLILLCGCSGKETRSDPLAEAERALARAAKLKAVAWAPADSEALGELAIARLAARAAGRPDLEVRALNEFGALEFRRDRFIQASLAFEQALSLARREDNRVAQAAALNGLGDIHLEKSLVVGNEIEKATAAYREALGLGRALADPLIEGKALYNLGNVYQSQRDWESSRTHYRQALALLRRSGGEADRRLAERGLGDVYFEDGEDDKALQTLGTALADSLKTGDWVAASYLLMSLGSIQVRLGEAEAAVSSFERALQLCEKVGAPLREAHAKVQLATANLHLGERERASELYRQGIDLYQREARSRGLGGLPGLLAFPLVFLGTQVQPQIGFDEAERRFYRLALDLANSGSTDAESMAVRTTTLHFYGRALNEAGKPREALYYLELADPIFRDRKARSYWARNQLELGKAHRVLRHDRPAERALESALAASRQLRDFSLEAVTLYEIAHLEKGRGRWARALAASTAALSIIDTRRSRVASQQFRTSFFASLQMYYQFHLDLLMDLHNQASRSGYDRTALEVSERARARVLLDLLTEGRIDITHSVPPTLKNREQEIERRVSRLQARVFRGQGDNAVNKALARTEKDRRQLDEEIWQQSPRYAEILHPVIRSVAEIQAHLDSETALLEYALTQSSVYLFVVTREDFASSRLLLTPEQVEQGVRTLRRDLVDRDNPYNFILRAADNHDFYRRLLGGADHGLLRSKKHWLIAADGPLQLLNFEVLLTRPPAGELSFDQPYLLHERTVHYIPSASVLAELMDRKSLPSPGRAVTLELFALADPRLSPQETGMATEREALTAFPPLLEARREVEGIANLFPRESQVVFQGDEATEKAVKAPGSEFSHARRLHLATHGTFDEQRPENSALLLAASLPGEDGRLTVAEIFNLRVAADLVVLSACNTGQGKQVAGEGLVGMARAFFYAGAPTLVVSLWQADDRATAQLMTSFYAGLRTQNKAEALTRAKREKARQLSPYYWAPFILLGQDAGPTP